MPTWLTILFSVIGAVGTVFGFLGIGAYMQERGKKKAQRRNAEEDEAEILKQQEYERRLRIIIQEENKPLSDKIDSLTVQVTKIEGASLSTIRDAITSCYYKCSAKGYRNDYDYQNMHHLYDNYRELHGNSYIADIMRRFDDLPPKEDTVPTKVVERTTKKKRLVEDN